MKLAIVIPIFDEAEVLPELFRRVRAACASVPDAQCRLIFVSDGSTDQSVPMILQEQRGDASIVLVELSRNFGHQPAIAAGLSEAQAGGAGADAVVIMDGDLQDPPELIPELVKCWRGGAEVVLAQRRSRDEHGPRRWCFDAFHRVFAWLSDFPIPPQTGVFGLLDRQAVERLNELGEKNRFFPGLRGWIGFEQGVVLYDRQDRSAGKPKQTFRRLFRYAFDAIFSFSYKPLRLMMNAGLFISFVAFVLAVVFVVKRLRGIEEAQTGFTTLITMVLFLGGVQLVAMGLLGEYIARIYDEVKRRPLYVVRRRRTPHAEPEPGQRTTATPAPDGNRRG